MEEPKKITSTPGSSGPLGANPTDKGVNFALFSTSATEVSIEFFLNNASDPFHESVLDPTQNRTENLWHIQVQNLPKNCSYAYRINKVRVIDPYAKELNASTTWGKKQVPLLGKVFPENDFDWVEDQPLHIPFEQLCIYEMHVRGFTQDKSSGAEKPGTFISLIEKIPYLKDLGINAIELLPIFEFDETANTHQNPNTGEKLFNYWGYSTLNFFSPMARYGTMRDFKTMVKALHEAKIEVILDVVFNHTGDLALHQIDDATYFILDDNGQHTNYTGCGNTVNSNHPVVIAFILSSLRYWVTEMHIDGFRFDLASIFCRNEKGEVLENPPLIESICNDSILQQTKFIAEAWDCAGLYQVGSFPGGTRFAEWNGKFRDIVRRFLKGTEGQASSFASVMMGSQDLYGTKAPYHSINFITAHDGFSLKDLVSYNDKHNVDNGEENRDGNNSNDSWNCGQEGSTDNPEIEALRQKQMRNFLLALTFAIGTPMYLMGDEYGHTRDGNNNTYCQDNKKNYFLWDALNETQPLHHFFQKLLFFRNHSPILQRTTFLTDAEVSWHGHEPEKPNWGNESRFVAYSIKDQDQDLYLAFNAHFEPAQLILPQLSDQKKWRRFMDTSFPEEPLQDIENHYHLASHSSLILISYHPG